MQKKAYFSESKTKRSKNTMRIMRIAQAFIMASMLWPWSLATHWVRPRHSRACSDLHPILSRYLCYTCSSSRWLDSSFPFNLRGAQQYACPAGALCRFCPCFLSWFAQHLMRQLPCEISQKYDRSATPRAFFVLPSNIFSSAFDLD